MDKPTCGKCGTEHWRFVACADAPEANAREAAAAQAKVQTFGYPARDKRTSFATEFATGGLRAPIIRSTNPPDAA